jgi:hypothetical protein
VYTLLNLIWTAIAALATALGGLLAAGPEPTVLAVEPAHAAPAPLSAGAPASPGRQTPVQSSLVGHSPRQRQPMRPTPPWQMPASAQGSRAQLVVFLAPDLDLSRDSSGG